MPAFTTRPEVQQLPGDICPLPDFGSAASSTGSAPSQSLAELLQGAPFLVLQGGRCAWCRPAFADPMAEASFNEVRLQRTIREGTAAMRILTVVSLLPTLHMGLDVRLQCWAARGCSLLAAVLCATYWLLLVRVPRGAGRLYNSAMLVYALLAVVAASFTSDRFSRLIDEEVRVSGLMEASSAVMVCAVLCTSATIVHMDSRFFLVLAHLSIAANFIIAVILGSTEHRCVVEVYSGIESHIVDHALNDLIIYVLALLLYLSRREQERQERQHFAGRFMLLRCGKTMERHLQECGQPTGAMGEWLAAYENLSEGVPQLVPRSSSMNATLASTPSLGDVRTRLSSRLNKRKSSVQSSVGSDIVEPRDLTVPPPPPLLEGRKAVPAKGGPERAPNPHLVKAMAGRTADWKRIQHMARNIRRPSYSLRSFYEDCVHSFPELRLFFDMGGVLTPKAYSDTASQTFQEQDLREMEYQRTMGALFSVYWLLRLDGDGKAGFCFGVDEAWDSFEKEHLLNSSAPALDASEKRTKFFTAMDWKPFMDLVSRAGCSPQDPNSEERVMALLCLTAFHDIMKVSGLQPIVQPQHAPYHRYEAGVRINDHDLALSYVMEHYPRLLPSFDGLPEAQKRGVLFTQGKMNFNHGWFVQAEAPPGSMLSSLKELIVSGTNLDDLSLYFLHWITDLAGAEGTPLGGAEKLVLKFPHAVLASFLWSMPYLSKLKGVTETALVEQYLEARWHLMRPMEAAPSDDTSIAVMRLVVMTQSEELGLVIQAFWNLPAQDRSCLVTELSRTGCADQAFDRHPVHGGPAFVIYYGPALLQRNRSSQESLTLAMHVLCVVLRAARALWPLKEGMEAVSVSVQITLLKLKGVEMILYDPAHGRNVWALLRVNDQEGMVSLARPTQINSLFQEGKKFRCLDFEEQERPAVEPRAVAAPSICSFSSGAVLSESPEESDADSRRVLVFTDMSTECDDECALIWLLAALNRLPFATTVELVQTDSHVRFQWMAHIFSDKFAVGGEWQVMEGGNAFQVGQVLVKMYLARSGREHLVISDIRKKSPNTPIFTRETKDGKLEAVRNAGTIGGEDYDRVRGGKLDYIVVAAALPDLNPRFFERFTACKCAYVVGSPGGINCPLPSWVGILAAMHRLTPVIYLTPQFTRVVRFPKSYVVENHFWNETIRHTVWDATLTFMARRPEIPAQFGNWGLILRINVANATFCQDWYQDVTGGAVQEAERSAYILQYVQEYVERNSGDDREVGSVLEELKAMAGEDTSCKALGIHEDELDAKGQPKTPRAKEALRTKYRHALYESTLICVQTTEAVLFQNPKNSKMGIDDGGFEQMQRRCGYADPVRSLCDVFGTEEAIGLLQELPLRRLTPAYDVVAMICAVSGLEEDTELDGGLGLLMSNADDSMGLGLLSEEQRRSSEHPILMTLPQNGEGVYGAGPFG